MVQHTPDERPHPLILWQRTRAHGADLLPQNRFTDFVAADSGVSRGSPATKLWARGYVSRVRITVARDPEETASTARTIIVGNGVSGVSQSHGIIDP